MSVLNPFRPAVFRNEKLKILSENNEDGGGVYVYADKSELFAAKIFNSQ